MRQTLVQVVPEAADRDELERSPTDGVLHAHTRTLLLREFPARLLSVQVGEVPLMAKPFWPATPRIDDALDDLRTAIPKR